MISFRELQQKSFYIGIFAVLTNIFFDKVFGPFAFVTLSAFIFLLFTILFADKKQKITALIISFGIILLLSDVMIITRDNSFVSSLFKLTSLSVLSLYLYALSNDRTTFTSLFELITAPLRTVRQYLQAGFTALRAILSPTFRKENISVQKEVDHSRKKALLIGITIAIPILAILITLLSKGDPVFSYYVRDIVNVLDIQRIMFTVFVFAMLFPLAFWKNREWSMSLDERIPKNKLLQEFVVVMTLVAVTMAAFLAVQWQYIFVSVPAETDLAQFGVKTYSEYVTKGFIELLQVAVLLYSLLWIGLILLRKHDFKNTFLKGIQYIVIGEFILFAISILRRTHLYQAYHGLTLIRVYGALFVLWLLVMIITLAARHFSRKPILKYEIIFSSVILLFIGFHNTDEFIARYSPPTVNDRVDYIYLSRLSSDGYVGWDKSFNHARQVLTDPRFNTDQLIQRDDRREIVYAGYILWHTIRHYYELILSHGTDEEVKDYFETLTRAELQASERRVKQYSADLLQAEKNDEQRFIKDQIYYEQDRARRLQKKMKQLEQKTSKEEVRYEIYPAFYIEPKVNYMTNDYYETIEASFYDVTEDYYHQNPKYKRDRLSRVYAWNSSQIRAYEWVKNNISLQEILMLQDYYFSLRNRVNHQPADERTFDQDVSLVRQFID